MCSSFAISILENGKRHFPVATFIAELFCLLAFLSALNVCKTIPVPANKDSSSVFNISGFFV